MAYQPALLFSNLCGETWMLWLDNWSKCSAEAMTFVTQRAVCEHSLLIMQNMPYGLFSMQHGSFELSDSQTRVLHN